MDLQALVIIINILQDLIILILVHLGVDLDDLLLNNIFHLPHRVLSIFDVLDLLHHFILYLLIG